MAEVVMAWPDASRAQYPRVWSDWIVGEPVSVQSANVPVSKSPLGTVTESTGAVCRSWLGGGAPTGPPACSKPELAGGEPRDSVLPSIVWFSGYRGSAPEGVGSLWETSSAVDPSSGTRGRCEGGGDSSDDAITMKATIRAKGAVRRAWKSHGRFL
jgi:hypothetical protein